jgi:hypothetical protein
MKLVAEASSIDEQCVSLDAQQVKDGRVVICVHTHRALGFGEPLSKLDFELRVLMRYRCDSGKDVTGQQAESKLVRVVKNDSVRRLQVKC